MPNCNSQASTMTKYLQPIAILNALSLPQLSNASYPSFIILPQSHRRQSCSSTTTAQLSSRTLIETATSFPPPTVFSNKIEQFIKSDVLVQIERTAQNERRISGQLTLNHIHDDTDDINEDDLIGMSDLWNILTDYNNLSTHVPNLVESQIINARGSYNRNSKNTFDVKSSKYIHETKMKPGPRIYQRGAQRIWGFEFGADLTMDMRESVIDYTAQHPTIRRKCILDFQCVSSQFFSQFDGSWIVEESNEPSIHGVATTTTVKYVVDVRPKGFVPVAALEWRIKEDVPTNMLGIVNAARGRQSKFVTPNGDFRDNDGAQATIDWYKDETLSMYL